MNKVWKRTRWLAAGALTMALLAGAAWTRWQSTSGPSWRTALVERGDVTQRIQATGTLNALIQVSVGTQVSGVVTALYADFNSLVKKGQVLARVDPTVLETQRLEALAAVEGARGTFENAQAELERYQHLAAEHLVSASDLNTRETTFRTAKAALLSAQAALGKARTNLGYCTITAPVDGVVVSREVDVGQTVAASLSTPDLFTVAQDLSRMKLQVSVDEADIGQVRVGQQATFTVDSYPGRTFQAQVSEVQLNPTTSNNVVTYHVILGVANESRKRTDGETGSREVASTALYRPKGQPVYQGDMALFPGMTASVSLSVARAAAVLRVPNAALRFDPGGSGSEADLGQGKGHVWVMEAGQPRRVEVETGLSDSRYTQVSGTELKEGMTILVGEDTRKQEATGGALLGQSTGAPPPPA